GAGNQEYEARGRQQQQVGLVIVALEGACERDHLRAAARNQRGDFGLRLRRGDTRMEARYDSSAGLEVRNNELRVADRQEEVGGKYTGDGVRLAIEDQIPACDIQR